MTKKKQAISDYITAQQAAQLLSSKGHQIRPGYIHKLKNVRFVKLDATTKLYHRADIEACNVRQRRS